MGKCQGVLGELDRMMGERIGDPHRQADLAGSTGRPTQQWAPPEVLVRAGTSFGGPREILVPDPHGSEVEPMVDRPQRVESHDPGGSNDHPRSRDRRTGVDPNTDGNSGHRLKCHAILGVGRWGRIRSVPILRTPRNACGPVASPGYRLSVSHSRLATVARREHNGVRAIKTGDDRCGS